MQTKFQEVNSGAVCIDMDKISLIRSLFAVKFSKFVSKDTFLTNIDELFINRNMKASIHEI